MAGSPAHADRFRDHPQTLEEGVPPRLQPPGATSTAAWMSILCGTVTATAPPYLPAPAFWRGKRVLVTGHTGFKGAWLTCWLRRLGATVIGVSLPEPVSAPALWDQLGLDGVEDVRADLTRDGAWAEAVREFSPQVVLHLAAQPLVSVGWREPARTFDVNVQGTVQVLQLVDGLPAVEASVLVTTDKVYDPRNPPSYAEGAPLGGHDPYSASKAAAELVVGAWPQGSPRGTARAGNVIGGGDWARDRLLPDLVRAWRAGEPAALRNPQAVRPWQHVLEPLRGYLLYAQELAQGRQLPPALNLGPSSAQAVPVDALVRFAADTWREQGGELPDPAWTYSDAPTFAETSLLTLDSTLAQDVLGWTSVLDWRAAVRLTLEWHHALDRGAAAADLVNGQLHSYEVAVQGGSDAQLGGSTRT